ncbi:hypothetical protein H5P28_11705 [Ruficoccus amylovorans]|uniref:Uncharacterized protein n=1 Tax=Ruficoccus amylovorans TaxID=1804625 RepID=A0A842HER6_9BACT|nr:hypothetical protein [Ruficoccus amylovorans]MBC2594922.1 hypothetical protein [Ruficoccus amylovorans]
METTEHVATEPAKAENTPAYQANFEAALARSKEEAYAMLKYHLRKGKDPVMRCVTQAMLDHVQSATLADLFPAGLPALESYSRADLATPPPIDGPANSNHASTDAAQAPEARN